MIIYIYNKYLMYSYYAGDNQRNDYDKMNENNVKAKVKDIKLL